jgi:hypothetical protein
MGEGTESFDGPPPVELCCQHSPRRLVFYRLDLQTPLCKTIVDPFSNIASRPTEEEARKLRRCLEENRRSLRRLPKSF